MGRWRGLCWSWGGFGDEAEATMQEEVVPSLLHFGSVVSGLKIPNVRMRERLESPNCSPN